jgi:uncharacterized membrane protein
MKRKISLILCAVLAVLPILLLAAVWGRLPEQVVTTWGFDGAVTGTGSKATLWGLVLMGPGIGLLLEVLPKIDPKRENYRKFQGHYDGFCVVFQLFMAAVNTAVIWENLSPGTLSIGRVVTVLVGLLFAFLGNILPTVRHNYFMGVRTPWTLADPRVWDRANRLGGRLFFLTGAVTVPLALLAPEQWVFGAFLALTAVSALVPTAASYFWFRKLHPGEEN